MRRIAEGYGLIDGPRWYEEHGLVYADMTNGGVHRIVDARPPEVYLAHRKGIGGLVAHAAGGFVVAGRNLAHKLPDAAGGATTVLLETAEDEVFFNDLTADDRGRVFVGSMAHNPLGPDEARTNDGRLYCIDVDGSSWVVSDDVLASNGLGIDPDATVLYHVDSGRKLVWAFTLDQPSMASRRPFADTSEYGGVPDGLAVAADGSVWVAMAGGSVVVAWDAKGRRVVELELPQPLVTGVAFGGPDGTTLWITTGTGVGDEVDEIGGAVYVTSAQVPGLPGPYARVRLP
ncbi:MAG: hypothetical protein JWN67_1406 [Actinomycetia bacterium]|nr:hypothetical protein [Actinomycetes bacterium]